MRAQEDDPARAGECLGGGRRGRYRLVGKTVLHYAAGLGQLERVKALVDAGAGAAVRQGQDRQASCGDGKMQVDEAAAAGPGGVPGGRYYPRLV